MNLKVIKAGETCFAKENAEISTVVGSCLAFCVFDKVKKMAGMCHYSLPSREYVKDTSLGDLFIGAFAIKDLLRKFKQEGSSPAHLEVYIVGGADSGEAISREIARKNIEVARDLCAAYHLPIKKERLSGPCGFKVRLLSQKGDLFVKTLESLNKPANRQAEKTKENLPIRETKTAHSLLSSDRKKAVKEAKKTAKIMIVDDSKVIQKIFASVFEKDPFLEVFAIASDPYEAEDLMKKSLPDVIILDVQMPKMDGLTYLAKYLSKRKTPVIVVSGSENDGGLLALKAMELGAIDFVEKPDFQHLADFSKLLKTKIEVALKAHVFSSSNTLKHRYSLDKSSEIDPRKMVVIGSSTGGVEALTTVIHSLPTKIPPILIVQHIPGKFSRIFAERLNTQTSFTVKEALDHDIIKENCIYIAPGDKQMKVKEIAGKKTIRITDDAPVNRHKPSVDYLFSSVAKINPHKTVAVILTGMGKDGAKGMLELANLGASTFAQDEASSVVYGMPKEAVKLGAAQNVVSLYDVADVIMEACLKKRKISA